VGAEMFYADGQRRTDMTNLGVAFRNFLNAPKNHKCSFDLILLMDNYV